MYVMYSMWIPIEPFLDRFKLRELNPWNIRETPEKSTFKSMSESIEYILMLFWYNAAKGLVDFETHVPLILLTI